MTSTTLGPGASHMLGEAQRPRCQKQDPRGRNTPRSRDRRGVEEQPFRLAPNKAISDDVAWQCKHYTGRGVMKLHESRVALAGDMGVLVSKMEESIAAHCQASLKTAQDLDEGPFPAYPGGKSWDEVPGKTGSGKKFHRDVISGADFTAPQA